MRINIFNKMAVSESTTHGGTKQAKSISNTDIVQGSGPYSHGDAADICPVCSKKMTISTIGKENVFFCEEHRITMPVPE